MAIHLATRLRLGKIVRAWKQEWWTDTWYSLSEATRFDAIKEFLLQIYVEFPSLATRNLRVNQGKKYMAINSVKENWIVINRENVSMISSLHELGHLIYGVGEEPATRFSISFFRTFFPKEYLALKRNGMTPPKWKHANQLTTRPKTSTTTNKNKSRS